MNFLLQNKGLIRGVFKRGGLYRIYMYFSCRLNFVRLLWSLSPGKTFEIHIQIEIHSLYLKGCFAFSSLIYFLTKWPIERLYLTGKWKHVIAYSHSKQGSRLGQTTGTVGSSSGRTKRKMTYINHLLCNWNKTDRYRLGTTVGGSKG